MEGRDEELIETFIENLKGEDNLKYSHGWKVKAIPIQAWTGRGGSRSLRPPKFLENLHMNVAWL